MNQRYVYVYIHLYISEIIYVYVYIISEDTLRLAWNHSKYVNIVGQYSSSKVCIYLLQIYASKFIVAFRDLKGNHRLKLDWLNAQAPSESIRMIILI